MKRALGAAQKKSGMHCCIPDRFRFFVEPYLFFFLAFFFAAIRFSSHSIRNSRQRKLAERVIKLMYSDCARTCQEESE
jgi:hypothetical protein